MAYAAKILVVDDEKLIRWSLYQTLTSMGHEVFEAADGDEALGLVEGELPEIALLDIRLPGMNGIEVLRRIRAEHPRCAVAMISGHGTLADAVEAMKLGAVDYIQKPFQTDDVKRLVACLVEKVRLERQVDMYVGRERRLYGLEQIIGASPSMQQVRHLCARIGASDATTVLVEGESGTGKGLVAKVLHYASRRQRAPFVEVSSTTLVDSLVESELFGHEKGAFTDAKASKKGMFELAEGGTIFLDEIGDMPLPAQAKLLRVLEDRAFKRVGGVRDIRVDVRVVASTNRDLEQEVARERFRKDLFYRLAVLRIELAPLSSRPEDVPPLCEHFIAHFNREFRRRHERVSREAMEILQGYDWPGNVRELRNVIERAMILEDKTEIVPADLPASLLEPHGPTDGKGALHLPPGGVSLEKVELALLTQALELARGNQTKAARLLGLSRDTLRYRMKKHGIAVESSD